MQLNKTFLLLSFWLHFGIHLLVTINTIKHSVLKYTEKVTWIWIQTVAVLINALTNKGLSCVLCHSNVWVAKARGVRIPVRIRRTEIGSALASAGQWVPKLSIKAALSDWLLAGDALARVGIELFKVCARGWVVDAFALTWNGAPLVSYWARRLKAGTCTEDCVKVLAFRAGSGFADPIAFVRVENPNFVVVVRWAGGVLALAQAVCVVEPLLFWQLEISDAWRVAINWFAEAVASIVVKILVWGANPS